MFGSVIQGERVNLMPPRSEDSASFQRWLADMEVTRFLLHRHPPSPRQEEQFLETVSADPTRVLWEIVLTQDDKPIGATSLVGEILRAEWDALQEKKP